MRKVIISTLMFVAIHGTFAQGFVNLGFEDANLSGYGAGSVPAADAIPGWTAYLGRLPLTDINYNVNAVTNGPGVYIYNSTVLQGNYYAYLEGTQNQPASIGQTATIPMTAQSLMWWGVGAEVSFNGHALSLSSTDSGAHYYIFTADISAFAGQTRQLLFSSTHFPAAGGDTIDNIQFSLIPEPSVLSLLSLGSLIFLRHRYNAKALL